jgi:signal transduction histidine kinase
MKIRTKILGGFLIIIALSLLLGIPVFFNTSDVSMNFTFLVEHDLQVLQNAQKLQKLVVDAETGQRGFIITGDDSFLKPYYEGIDGFNDLIEIEKQLVSDNPPQVQRLEKIQILFDKWQTNAAELEINAAKDYFESFNIESNPHDFSSVSQLIKNKIGKNILDDIRNEFTIFIQIENHLKDDRLSNVLATSIFTEILLILLPVSIIIVSVIIAFVLTRSISKPLEVLKQTSYKIASGNLDTKINQHDISSAGDEIKELASTFNIMLDSIKNNTELEKRLAVEKEKVKNAKINALGNVTSSLAHNLKNPLSVIKATTSIIEATSNSVDKKTQERLNLIKVSTENMLNQIEDMLDFVKQKPLELQETSLSEILNIAIDNINKPKRIKINLPENDIKIKCDSAKLQVVFMNLISNSIDSVNGNGEITIDSYQNNQDTVMEVTDTGSINPDDLEKMFEVLYTTKPTGTGLGLPYCKSVIEQHGGNIEVSMNPTKFTIIIPRLD